MNNLITVKKTKTTSFKVYGNFDFFKKNRNIVFDFDDYGFSFRVPSISDDYTIMVSKNGVNGSVITIPCEYLKTGRFKMNQDHSDEDKIVFDY